MKVAIDKELQQKQKSKEVLSLDPLKEVKLLLQGEESEDARILRGLSNNSNYARIEKATGQVLEVESLDKKYAGNVFTYEQIKKLAVDYHLRFLAASYYTGSFDVEVAAKIKEFAKETLAPIDNYSLSRNYFILAPAELFKLQDERYISKREKDPAIFYRIDDNHYRLIHKWGNDFSILRYLEGFRWKSFGKHWLFNTAMVMPFVAIAYAFLLPVSAFENWTFSISAAVIATSFVISHIVWNWSKLDDFEVIQSFFSEANWNSDKRITR